MSIAQQEPGRPVFFTSSLTANSAGPSSAEAAVDAAYRQVLKRPADAAGLQQYAPSLRARSLSIRDIVRDLVRSDEWAAKFVDDRPVEETVLALYDCLLARAPDVDGWNQLLAWEPRDDWQPVIDSMIDGEEYGARFGSAVVPGTMSRAGGDATLGGKAVDRASEPAAAKL